MCDVAISAIKTVEKAIRSERNLLDGNEFLREGVIHHQWGKPHTRLLGNCVPPEYPVEGSCGVADAIRSRRGKEGLYPLDGVLLNAPEVASGWNGMLGAIRNRTSIPGDLRELIVSSSTENIEACTQYTDFLL